MLVMASAPLDMCTTYQSIVTKINLGLSPILLTLSCSLPFPKMAHIGKNPAAFLSDLGYIIFENLNDMVYQ